MKHITLTALTLVSTLLGGALTAGTAEAAGHARYASPAYVETQNSVAAVQDDHIDLAVLNQTILQWQVARRTLNVWSEREADARLMSLIQQELAENQREALQAQQEAARSRAELRYSARNAAANRGYYGTAEAARADGRALEDDRRDAQSSRIEAQRFNGVARELMALQPSFDAGRASPQMYKRKADLLRTLRQMAAAELQGSRGELNEDRYEDAGGYVGYAPPPPPYRR